uniref:Uncharacterized protein n=1 Tax=Megaselia scalaris TaxID=36166 RepID=T1GT37_MEGSC
MRDRETHPKEDKRNKPYLYEANEFVGGLSVQLRNIPFLRSIQLEGSNLFQSFHILYCFQHSIAFPLKYIAVTSSSISCIR